jgi:teichuronic acid biosynthesis glycosyltransferase TuaG
LRSGWRRIGSRQKGAGQQVHNRVSVIIPTWNRAPYLSTAITSVLNQTYPVHEIIVCDDGSTDDSEAVVRGFSDPKVKWLPGPRAGRPAIPRNRGLAASKGEWIAFLDSDDEWLADKLEQQFESLHGLKCTAACSNALRMSPNGQRVGEVVFWTKSRIALNDLLKTNQVVCSSVLMHRSLLAHVSGFPEQQHLTACEDYALWLRVSTQTDFAFVPKALVLYNDNPEVSIRNTNPDAAAIRRDVLNDFIAWIAAAKQPEEFARRARKTLALSPVDRMRTGLKRVLDGWTK